MMFHSVKIFGNFHHIQKQLRQKDFSVLRYILLFLRMLACSILVGNIKYQVNV